MADDLDTEQAAGAQPPDARPRQTMIWVYAAEPPEGLPLPQHTINVWSAVNDTWRIFTCGDLSAAIAFALRVYKIPNTSKVEVLEQFGDGEYNYADCFEAQKPWHAGMMDYWDARHKAEEIANANPMTAARIINSIKSDPNVESCNECADDSADPAKDATMNGWVWVPSIGAHISNDGTEITGAGYPRISKRHNPGMFAAWRIRRAIRRWRDCMGIPPVPGFKYHGA